MKRYDTSGAIDGTCPECHEDTLYFQRGFPETRETPEELPEVYCTNCEWRAENVGEWIDE